MRSDLFGEQGFERAEADWAQSEVGEGIEEVWERAVSPDVEGHVWESHGHSADI